MNIVQKIKHIIFVKFRILKYKWLSTCKNTFGNPIQHHPMLLEGEGTVVFGTKVQIGVVFSSNFYSHYSYLEARFKESQIIIGNNVSINNAFSAVAFSKITIEDNVLIGINCAIIDNDGHHLEIDKRTSVISKSAEVLISKNVFIGDNVSILKGVTIGQNSVIGFGSVVTKSIPENVVAAGNPAQIIRAI
ncbi:acyltransferase [uncultured Flavobacterium sp.]|uniref:acyltransferase n=1 Tax=uncultured Flavobacterium sp. TaxID=165435 RepID=UPI0030CA5338|tara:strand:- start:2836 stop:3405 length:570 start_codon:yes stop_codon:yes gene_type:complete